jgi:glutamate-ammonia-ligase adenylyltransferase
VTRPSRLARYGFADNGARAADLLGPNGLRLWDAESQEPVDSDAAELIHALSRAADPNLALRQLHRMIDAVARAAERGTAAR